MYDVSKREVYFCNFLSVAFETAFSSTCRKGNCLSNLLETQLTHILVFDVSESSVHRSHIKLLEIAL